MVDGELSNKWSRMTALNSLINFMVTENGTNNMWHERKDEASVMCTAAQRTELKCNQNSGSNYPSTETKGSC